MTWQSITTGSSTSANDYPTTPLRVMRIGLSPALGWITEELTPAEVSAFYDNKPKQEVFTMAALITISIRNIQDFDPVAVDLEEARFALAQITALKNGYLDGGMEVPKWLLKKLRETKRSLELREQDANAAELARLEAQLEALKSREEKLTDVQAKIDALRAKVGPESE